MSPLETCLLILAPMIGTVGGERLFHRFGDPKAAVYVAGYHVHHLFFGLMLTIPCSFLLAFDLQRPPARRCALLALGLGTGFILDEFVAMIATDMSTPAYLGSLSFNGAVAATAFCSAALVGLAALKAGRR